MTPQEEMEIKKIVGLLKEISSRSQILHVELSGVSYAREPLPVLPVGSFSHLRDYGERKCTAVFSVKVTLLPRIQSTPPPDPVGIVRSDT